MTDFDRDPDGLRLRLARAGLRHRLARVPPGEVAAVWRVSGVAPRLGHLLRQVAETEPDEKTAAARDVAEGVLRTGDYGGLPVLADALDEADHPLRNAVDWRSAPRALDVDHAVADYLDGVRRNHPDADLTDPAGHVLRRLRSGRVRGLGLRAAVADLRGRVSGAGTRDLYHSLARHDDAETLRDHAEMDDRLRAAGRKPVWLEPEMAHGVVGWRRRNATMALQTLGVTGGDPFRYETPARPRKLSRAKLDRLKYAFGGRLGRALGTVGRGVWSAVKKVGVAARHVKDDLVHGNHDYTTQKRAVDEWEAARRRERSALLPGRARAAARVASDAVRRDDRPTATRGKTNAVGRVNPAALAPDVRGRTDAIRRDPVAGPTPVPAKTTPPTATPTATPTPPRTPKSTGPTTPPAEFRPTHVEIGPDGRWTYLDAATAAEVTRRGGEVLQLAPPTAKSTPPPGSFETMLPATPPTPPGPDLTPPRPIPIPMKPPAWRTKGPRKMAAYRAPAGGMVVRGLFYGGGELVPSLDGPFANPPPREPTRQGPTTTTADRLRRLLRRRSPRT